MKLVPVSTPERALAVALIRNECRKYMTHDTTALSVKRQIQFFNHTLAKKGIYVFVAKHKRMPIGYAVLRLVNDAVWITGGLANGFRGKGLGKQLFKSILRLAPRPVWLDVRRSNKRAIHLYLKLGFRIIRSTRRLLVMKFE